MRSGPFLILLLAGMFIVSSAAAHADQNSDTIRMLRSEAVEAHVNGNFQRALDAYNKALNTAKSAYGENSPFLAEIYYDMGSLCLSYSDFDRAETYLKETVRLNPNSSIARLRLAELYRLRSRPDEAAKQASLVLAKHRDDLVAHQELALAYEANSDNIRAYKEYSALDQLVQREHDIAEGKFVPVKFTMPFFTKPAAPAPKPLVPPDDADKKAAEAKKKAEADAKKFAADAKKAEADAKKKAEQDKKKAEQDKKKAEQDKKKSDEKKKADDKKRAEDKKKLEDKKKADEKKKAEQSTKAASVKPSPVEDADNSTGLPAKLRSKAVLLTPVGKKKGAASESSTTTTVPKKAAPAKAAPAEEDSSSGGDEPEEAAATPPKKIKPTELKPMVPKADPVAAKPKAGKHAAGLVPPPPPVVPTYQPMVMPPQPMAPAPKPKPPAPKKVEEKPKETPAAGNDKPEDEDWLLDFAGTKPKGKKK